MKIKIKTDNISFESELLNIQSEGCSGETLIKFLKELIDNVSSNSLKIKNDA